MANIDETTPAQANSTERPKSKKMGSGLVGRIFKGSKRKNKRSLLRDESGLLDVSNQQSTMKNQVKGGWSYRAWNSEARGSSSLSYILNDEYRTESSENLEDVVFHPDDQIVDGSHGASVKQDEWTKPQLSRFRRQPNFRDLHIDTRQETRGKEIVFCRQLSHGCEKPLAVQRGPLPASFFDESQGSDRFEKPRDIEHVPETSASFLDESDSETSSIGTYLDSEEVSVSSDLSGSDYEDDLGSLEEDQTSNFREPSSFGDHMRKESKRESAGEGPSTVLSPSKSKRVMLRHQYYKQKLANSPAMMRDRLLSSSSECNLASYLEVSMRIY